jgi:hypothetical protein
VFTTSTSRTRPSPNSRGLASLQKLRFLDTPVSDEDFMGLGELRKVAPLENQKNEDHELRAGEHEALSQHREP